MPEFERVKPGDLISSEFFNRILDKLDSLQAQISAIGTGTTPTGPIITGTLPSGAVRMLDNLTIYGANFLYPPDLNSVTINGVPVRQFLPGSDTTKIALSVPFIANVPATGHIVVNTRGGSAPAVWDQLQILAMQQVPTGRLAMGLVGTDKPNAKLLANTQYLYEFKLQPIISVNEFFSFDVAFSDSAGGQWSGRVLDSNKTTDITKGSIQLQVGVPKTLYVSFTTPAAGSASLNLVATSFNNPNDLNTSLSAPLKVGADQPINDPRIVVGPFDAADFPSGRPGQLVQINPATGDRVLAGGVAAVGVPFGAKAAIAPQIQFGPKGTYKLDVDIAPDAGPWVVDNLFPTKVLAGDDARDTIPFELTLNQAPGAVHTEKRLLTIRVTQLVNNTPGATSALWIPIVGV